MIYYVCVYFKKKYHINGGNINLITYIINVLIDYISSDVF